MKKPLVFTLFLTFSASAIAQAVDDQRNNPRAIVPSDQPIPVAVPAANKQVAVITLAFDFVDGKVKTARKVKSERIRSIAPKVFARKSGAWEVTINGARTHRFYMSNPGYREAEAHGSSEGKYEWVAITGSIEWPVVVPLYRDGEALQARSITIKDARSGEVIFETEI